MTDAELADRIENIDNFLVCTEATRKQIIAALRREPNAAPQENRGRGMVDSRKIESTSPDLLAPAGAAPSALAEEIERALNVLEPLCKTDYLFTAPNAAPGCELRISTLRNAIAALKDRA